MYLPPLRKAQVDCIRLKNAKAHAHKQKIARKLLKNLKKSLDI